MALIRPTPEGLYCAAGDFHIDPWRPVSRAVLTHAHADHARPGSGRYHAASPGLGLLRHRLGADCPLHGLEYGEVLKLGDARVSLHPAGHVLGSAQVRVEVGGEVWVVTGDYKRDPDPTCAPFEALACDTLISEATFALPVYRWRPAAEVVAEIFRWWEDNRAAGRASVLFAYALGKAQRVLAELTHHTDRAVYAHGAVEVLTGLYREAGVAMLPTLPVPDARRTRAADFAGELIIAPPGANGTPWMRRFGAASTGFCSGWMLLRGNRRRRGYDRGFVLSDHVDWPGLIATVRETGARRVLATHGQTTALARYLRERGLDAEPLSTRYGEDEDA